MGKIHVLDKHTAELIAAGEVVERPSSVIKELFENSVDAGATTITVEIEHGGITLMRIQDNGIGISREDIKTAFLRHATSKVSNENDLECIETLGFRGEALASISAVSYVDIVTRTDEEDVGSHYVIEGGEEKQIEDVGCAKGTTFTVKNLFYNVPARMKFLKTDLGEGNAVAGVVEKLALSHPEIAVTFIRDGKEVISTYGDGDLFSCIYRVLGKEFSNTLMPVEYSLNGVSIHGYVNKAENGRANRTMQFFFINGRYVKTRTGAAAIEQAYKGSLMVGRFPTCVLFINLPNIMVDVNVHPSKIEVRFVNEKPVFDAVYYGCKNALASRNERKHVTFQKPKETISHEQLYIPFSDVEKKKDENRKPTDITGVGLSIEKNDFVVPSAPVNTNAVLKSYPSADVSFDEIYIESSKEKTEEKNTKETTNTKDGVTVSLSSVSPDTMAIRYIGEIFNTYILCEMNGELYLIDKHAAHERILYNQFKKEEHTESQQLLEPIPVSLTSDEYGVLIENIALLEKAGFEIDSFGTSEIIVRAVPIVLAEDNISEIIREIAGNFVSGKSEVIIDKLDWLYHNTACRAAIKAGNHNVDYDLIKLAEKVLMNNDIRTCPHGRPVCVSISKKEIEKQFGRIV